MNSRKSQTFVGRPAEPGVYYILIKHKNLNKQVSYKRLIRLDCYKLVKHIIGEAKYSGFKMWW